MSQATFTGQTKAWISSSTYKSMNELVEILESGNIKSAVDYVTYANHDMSLSGWTHIGAAEITVTLLPQEDIVSKEVEGLKKQLQAVRAEAQMRENAILDRISKLQALTYDEVTA